MSVNKSGILLPSDLGGCYGRTDKCNIPMMGVIHVLNTRQEFEGQRGVLGLFLTPLLQENYLPPSETLRPPNNPVSI